MRARRLPAALLACAAALALAGCGQEGEDNSLAGETEGAYIDFGAVKYQVQLSRILNTASIEDQALVRDVPPTESQLGDDEAWFGVWMRAENESEQPQPKVEEFEIRDTLGNTFEPFEQEENILSWAWQPDVIPPKGTRGLIPIPDSHAAEAAPQGSLLLFKLPYEALENRPLELELVSPEQPDVVGHIDLDV